MAHSLRFEFRKHDMNVEEENSTLLPARNKAAVTKVNSLTVTNALPHNHIASATSNNTRRAYQSDIRHFIQAGSTLPASFDDILRYLQHYAATLNPRTLERRLTELKTGISTKDSLILLPIPPYAKP